MSNAVITTRYTLVDFPTESDMTAFFVFVEQNYEQRDIQCFATTG